MTGRSILIYLAKSYPFANTPPTTLPSAKVGLGGAIFMRQYITQACGNSPVPTLTAHYIALQLAKLLKVPKCEIFDPFFFTPINPIWVGDLRTREKKQIFEDYGRYSPFCFFYAG